MIVIPANRNKRVTPVGRRGMATETVGLLVITVAALILLWILFQKLAPDLTDLIANIARGLICGLCNELLGAWKHMVIFCWGC